MLPTRPPAFSAVMTADSVQITEGREKSESVAMPTRPPAFSAPVTSETDRLSASTVREAPALIVPTRPPALPAWAITVGILLRPETVRLVLFPMTSHRKLLPRTERPELFVTSKAMSHSAHRYPIRGDR